MRSEKEIRQAMKLLLRLNSLATAEQLYGIRVLKWVLNDDPLRKPEVIKPPVRGKEMPRGGNSKIDLSELFKNESNEKKGDQKTEEEG